MNLLVTAGNTQTPIDRVRCITNIFTGRTGAAIALEGCLRGHSVTLLTSHPETIPPATETRLRCIPYRTFAELRQLMKEVCAGSPDALVHAAAVGDYES